VAGWNCACGALFDAFKCRQLTNRFLAYCCLKPINHEPLATLVSSKIILFSLFYQSLDEDPQGVGHSWHGARTIDHRADAQTLIQLNIFLL
jgi:hypothetical protein